MLRSPIIAPLLFFLFVFHCDHLHESFTSILSELVPNSQFLFRALTRINTGSYLTERWFRPGDDGLDADWLQPPLPAQMSEASIGRSTVRSWCVQLLPQSSPSCLARR